MFLIALNIDFCGGISTCGEQNLSGQTFVERLEDFQCLHQVLCVAYSLLCDTLRSDESTNENPTVGEVSNVRMCFTSEAFLNFLIGSGNVLLPHIPQIDLLISRAKLTQPAFAGDLQMCRSLLEDSLSMMYKILLALLVGLQKSCVSEFNDLVLKCGLIASAIQAQATGKNMGERKSEKEIKSTLLFHLSDQLSVAVGRRFLHVFFKIM